MAKPEHGSKPHPANPPTARSDKTDQPKDLGGKPVRTLGNHPADPNSLAAKANFPPGVDAETAHDPGANIPSKPKVENQS